MKHLLLFLLLCLFGWTSKAQQTDPGQKFLELGKKAQKSQFQDSALYYFRQAQAYYKENEQWQKYIQATAGANGSLMTMSKWEQARENALSGIALHDSKNFPVDRYYLELLNMMGRINWRNTGDFDQALKYLHRSRALLDQIDNPAETNIRIDTELGWTHAYAGNYDSSVYYMENAVALTKETYGERSGRMADVLSSLVYAYSENSQLDKAEKTLKRATQLNIELRGEDHIATLKCYSNLSYLYLQKSDNDQAIFYLKKSLPLLLERFGPDISSVGYAYINLGAAYSNKGVYPTAITYKRLGYDNLVKTLGPENPTIINTLTNLANNYAKLEMKDSAIYFFDKALASSQRIYGEQHPELVKLYGYLNDFYLESGFIDKAETGILTNIEMANQVLPEKHLHHADNYYQLATLMNERGKKEEALRYCQMAIIKIMLEFDNTDYRSNPITMSNTVSSRKLLEVFGLKIRLLLDRFYETREVDYLNIGLETANKMDMAFDLLRSEYRTPESKSTLLNNVKDYYETAIDIAFNLSFQLNDPSSLSEAFVFMEKSKSVLLFERIQAQKEFVDVAVPDSLKNREESLELLIASLEEDIFNASASEDTSQVENLKKKRFRARQQHDFLLNQIQEVAPDYYSLRHQRLTISLEKTQDALTSNTLLVDYFVGQEDLYTLAISKNTVRAEKVAEFDITDVDELLTGIRNKEFDAVLAHKIYQKLLGPIEDEQSHYLHQLAIVPDAIIHYLPFEVLITDSEDPTSFLLKDHTIRYHHSATLPQRIRAQKEPKVAYLGFSPGYSKESNPLLASRSAENNLIATELNKLPMAAQEIRRSAEIWKGNYFTDSAATEASFKTNASEAGIIHIASHAIIDDEEPMRSRLVFSVSQDSTEDGLLHTYELYNLELSAQLACLSACNTGYGQLRSGEGVVSLAKGFFYAGVSNIMMSLWSVPDNSTAQIMEFFNEELEKGTGKAEALRVAKLRYLKQADSYSVEPYYWAAYTLIGDNEPVYSGMNKTPWIIGGGFLLVAFIGFFFYRRNKKMA